MHNLIEYFNKIVPLSDEQKRNIEAILQPDYLKKREIFLDYSERSDKIAFIETGLLEMTMMGEDGNEKIVDFLLPNSFATDYLNFLLDNLSEIKITAIQDSKLLCFRKKELNELYEKDITFQKIGRIISEKYYIEFVQRLRDNNLSAKERYELIKKNNPDLIQQVPQYKIASFLNISAEWLSKIRAQK